MSYAVKDVSATESAPVEFYKFTGNGGTFRYTTDTVPGVCNGELYVPIPGGVRRTAIETSTATDSNITCDITVAIDTDLAKMYCFSLSPDDLMVEIRRAHRGDDWNTEWRVEWIGFGMDTSISGDTATIKTGSALQAKFTTNIASIYYQRTCNHALFDSRCKIVKADWTLTAEITKVQSSIITVDADGSGNDALSGGEIVHVPTGESRTIYGNLDDVITMSFPFTNAKVGDAVQLVFGCDHSRLGDCRNRFNNTRNYGGFDFIPTTNPFADLKLNSKITTKIKSDMYRTIAAPGSIVNYP